MDPALTPALKPGLRLLERDGPTAGLEEPGRKRLRLRDPEGGLGALLEALARGGRSEAELCPGTGPGARARRYLLARLEREGWLCWALARDGRELALLEPLAPAFRYRAEGGEGAWRLSRFSWVRRVEGQAVLEHPLGLARLRLLAPELLELVGLLCRPRRMEELAAAGRLDLPVVRGFLELLAAAGAGGPCTAQGELPEDRDPALRPWEFHDLLFHSRSRPGWHDAPSGATLRFLGELDPQPVLKPCRTGLSLPEPGPPGTGPPFFQVLAARRSRREPGPAPITLDQLGAFLHHVARVREVLPAAPGAGRPCAVAAGPCPGGGGLRELELYLSVGRCAGLVPGFYRYAADGHQLEPWPGDPEAARELLGQAQASMGAAAAPDLLVTLAARVQRVAWKYQTIAYALILKDAGVMLQQMYLVATALGLAPCAIGTGDTQLFARASGLAGVEETSVAEFALSGCAGMAS
jgi:SagB-type dehydrogenase family enzyme